LALGLPLVAAGFSLANNDTTGLFQLARSEAVTLAATLVLKSATHETRPNGRDNKSFPSGHASVAFSAAQYLQMRGGWQYGVPAYIAATAVGYSRVDAKEHYWKDVIAGAALGIGTTYWLTDSLERRGLAVALTPHSAQIQLSQRW
jgi:membrane-associated phospholipid phosphatase